MQLNQKILSPSNEANQEQVRLQLTNQQYHYLLSLLPKGYSLQTQVKNLKRTSKIAKQKNQYSNNEPNQGPTVPQRIRKVPSTMMYNQQIQNTYTLPKLISGRRSSVENLTEELYPCHRILSLLKNNKNSWPFRDPVDPIALNIPNYRDIIQEPMDLLTVENNLKTNQYFSATQFHADINKIIRNSYTFNHSNPQFCKITQQFEKYYFKIISEPSQKNYNESTNIPALQAQKSKKGPGKKKFSTFETKASSQNQPPTLAEKKQLTLQIMRLNKEDLKGVIQIVYTNQSDIKPTFDVEDLDHGKIRQLQRYVQSKLSIQDNTKPQQKNQHLSTNQVHSEQSSFVVDDSD